MKSLIANFLIISIGFSQLSIKKKLFIEGLEIYLNANNFLEAVDVTRRRGFSLQDPDFDNSYYDEILE